MRDGRDRAAPYFGAVLLPARAPLAGGAWCSFLDLLYPFQSEPQLILDEGKCLQVTDHSENGGGRDVWMPQPERRHLDIIGSFALSCHY